MFRIEMQKVRSKFDFCTRLIRALTLQISSCSKIDKVLYFTLLLEKVSTEAPLRHFGHFR